MRDEVREILAKVFRVPVPAVRDDASPDTIPGWDSLAHLQLIAALEQRFGARFQLREIQTMDSLPRIEAVLAMRARSGG